MRTAAYRTILTLSFLIVVHCDSRPRNINTILKDPSISENDGNSKAKILELQFSDFEEDTFTDHDLKGKFSLAPISSYPSSGMKGTSDQNAFESKIILSDSTYSLPLPNGKYEGVLEIEYKRRKLFGAMVYGEMQIFFGKKENLQEQTSDSCVSVPSSSNEKFQLNYICPSLDSDRPIALQISLVKNTKIRWGISGLWWTTLAGVSIWSLASSPLGLIVVGSARGGVFLVPIFKYQELGLKKLP
ncbi:hypothetical protein EHO59_14040 [Leptospira semungkisensis]|uniref:Uncharacterized protein n=1 Tax=Leptospira semungkisensis TaxID=2484985 RepID=A0A4R9FR77_9LEPT|nr:hypothetical protein [Leptospira semungkisensis]TGK01033.1 hypothetical protein EHO59_14040 [Leptospira semungkisensis]